MACVDELKNAINWGNHLKGDLIKSRNLGYLVLLATTVTIVVGFLLFLIDPNIKTLMDGIWSAWVTMTHVGFGDVVPVSFFGRLLAALLILFGLVFFSIFTALVSVAFIGRNIDALGGNFERLENETHNISGGEERILQELTRLHQRLETLEAQLLIHKGQ